MTFGCFMFYMFSNPKVRCSQIRPTQQTKADSFITFTCLSLYLPPINLFEEKKTLEGNPKTVTDRRQNGPTRRDQG